MNKRKGSSVTRWQKFAESWRESVGSLATYLDGPHIADFDRLHLRQRGPDDWLVVVKAFDDKGAPVVCFGFGVDAFTALIAANGSVESGRWQADKPYKAK